MDSAQSPDLRFGYEEFPRLEERFGQALDVSLTPRGPGTLLDLVESFSLGPRAVALDVGCGEGAHAMALQERFELSVVGIDPSPAQIERARMALNARPRQHDGGTVAFVRGSLDHLPVGTAGSDLVWCRDVMVHVADVDQAYREIRRVLRPGGRALTYQMLATDLLEPRERHWLFRTMGVVASSADSDAVAAAIDRSGLQVVERIDVGTEWGEHAQESAGKPGRALLHAARLIRARERYVTQFGQPAYDLKLGDALWHVYAMIGKLTRRIYSLRA